MMDEQPRDRLLCVKEAAKYLGVSLTTIHRLIAQGDIPVIRIAARLWRFDVSDLRSYIKKQREVAEKQIQAKLTANKRRKAARRGDD